jgi:hypothetical protein
VVLQKKSSEVEEKSLERRERKLLEAKYVTSVPKKQTYRTKPTLSRLSQ